MKQIDTNNSGFSFIELLVASAIVFSLVLGIAQLTLESMSVKRRADCRLNAAALFSSQLELLKSQYFSGSLRQAECLSEAITTRAENQVFIIEWALQALPEGMTSIEMRCFPESSPLRETRLILYLSDELGF